MVYRNVFLKKEKWKNIRSRKVERNDKWYNWIHNKALQQLSPENLDLPKQAYIEPSKTWQIANLEEPTWWGGWMIKDWSREYQEDCQKIPRIVAMKPANKAEE